MGGEGGEGGTGGGDGGGGGGSVDTTAPTLLSSTPSEGATSVSVGAAITLQFSEAIEPSSFSISIVPAHETEAPVFSNNNATVNISSTSNRQPDTMYAVTIVARDLANLPLEPSGSSFSFTTGALPDTTSPSVQLTMPADNATNVALANLAVTVKFSEPVRPSSVRLEVNGNFDIGQPTFPSADTARWAAPVDEFTPDSTYTMTVSAADLAGNGMATGHTFRFSTGVPVDAVAPRVLRMFPANDSTAVARNSSMVFFFSEPMNAPSVESALRVNGATRTGTATWDAAKTILRFTPTTMWAAANHVVTFMGGTDVAGNVLTSFASNFTSTGVDSVAPTVTTTTPASGQLDYQPYAGCDLATRRPRRISVTFDELIDPLSVGPAVSVESPAGSPIAGVVSFSATGRSFIFTPEEPLGYNRTYLVRVNTAGNTARDLSANPLANHSFTFRTLKRVVYALNPVMTETGRIYSGPVTGQTQVSMGTAITVGEATRTGVYARGVAGFPITTTVPANVVCINEATLTMTQLGVNGSPYPTLGRTVLEAVRMGTVISVSDYASAPVAGLPVVNVTDDPTPGATTVDVTPHLRYILDPTTVNGLLVRFRLRFTNVVVANSVLSNATFQTTAGSPRLVVTAEVP